MATPAPMATALAGIGAPAPRLVPDPDRAGSIVFWLRNADLQRWAVFLFGIGAMGAGVGQWLPALARDSCGLGSAAGGWVMALSLAGVGAARLTAGRWIQRVGLGWMMTVSVFLTAGLILLIALIGPIWPVGGLMAGILVGAASGALWPSVLGYVAQRLPAGGGIVFGLLSAAGNTGCFVAPWAIGALADFLRLESAMAVLLLAAGLCWRILRATGLATFHTRIPTASRIV